MKIIARYVKTAAVAAAAVMMLCAAAPAQEGGMGGDMSGVDPEKIGRLMTIFSEKIEHRYAPVFESVEFGPAKRGEPVEVTAVVGYDTRIDEETKQPEPPADKIEEVAVYYSTDGGETRFHGPVLLKPQMVKNTWKGEIPPIDSRGEVLVVPYAKDSYGNVGVSTACEVSSWPPFEDPCMAPGAVDAEPVDDPPALIEDEYDIWDVQLGMDGDHVYIATDMEGNYSKGSVNPLKINAVMTMILDTETLKEFDNIMTLMKPEAREEAKKKADKMAMIMYAPLIKSMLPDVSGCAILRMDKAGGGKENIGEMFDDSNIKCKDQGTTVYMRINKAAFSASMKESMSIMAALNGYVDDPKMPFPALREFLAFTNLSEGSYSFYVK